MIHDERGLLASINAASPRRCVRCRFIRLSLPSKCHAVHLQRHKLSHAPPPEGRGTPIHHPTHPPTLAHIPVPLPMVKQRAMARLLLGRCAVNNALPVSEVRGQVGRLGGGAVESNMVCYPLVGRHPICCGTSPDLWDVTQFVVASGYLKAVAAGRRPQKGSSPLICWWR